MDRDARSWQGIVDSASRKETLADDDFGDDEEDAFPGAGVGDGDAGDGHQDAGRVT